MRNKTNMHLQTERRYETVWKGARRVAYTDTVSGTAVLVGTTRQHKVHSRRYWRMAAKYGSPHGDLRRTLEVLVQANHCN
jgi:hypothetical protein